MTHLIFDLDNTLISTSALRPYTATAEGRRYVAANPEQVPTQICHRSFVKLVRYHANRGVVSVVTNSPQDYAAALLHKHDFPDRIRIFASASKPSPLEIRHAIGNSGVSEGETVLIGDSAIDVLAAHAAGIASIAVTWGYSTKEQLERAEPADIVSKPEKLEEAISQFEEGSIAFSPRTEPGRYDFMPEPEFNAPNPQISLCHLAEYFPVSDPDFKSLPWEMKQFSRSVMDYKDVKDITLEELNSGLRHSFFYERQVRLSTAYKNIVNWLLGEMGRLLSSQGIEGKALIVGAPNSNPEYCYKLDINHLFARNLAKRGDSSKEAPDRFICRVHPKMESHRSGVRGMAEHYRTIGLKEPDFDGIDSIAILDDVITSGNQVTAIAKILRHAGFRGKFYALALGRTRGC